MSEDWPSSDESRFYYSTNTDGETVTITRIETNESDFEIPCYLNLEDDKEHKVTKLDTSSLYNNNDVKKVTVARNLIDVKYHAIMNCNNLKEVTIIIDESNKGEREILHKCPNLDTITFKTDNNERINVESIKHYIETVSTIIFDGNIEFEGSFCLNCDIDDSSKWPIMDKVILINNKINLKTDTFTDCLNLSSITIINGPELIESSSFRDCRTLKEVVLNSVNTIGESSFENCFELQSLVFDDSIQRIDSYAFSNCRSLEIIELTKNITSLGDGCFQHCHRLTKIIIKGTVHDFGNNVFYDCPNLEDIIISEHQYELLKKQYFDRGRNPFQSCSDNVRMIVKCDSDSNKAIVINLSTISNDSIDNSGIIEEGFNRLKKKVEYYGFRGFLHCTHIDNIVSILKDGCMKSRMLLDGGNLQYKDCANQNVIKGTKDLFKNNVRFYFAHDTPTTYVMIRDNGFVMAYLLFDWEIIKKEGAIISNGNMYYASYSEINYFDLHDYVIKGRSYYWKEIFDRQGIPNDNQKKRRNAELNIPNKISLNYLKAIILHDEEALCALINKLPTNILKKYRNLIIIDDSFYNSSYPQKNNIMGD